MCFGECVWVGDCLRGSAKLSDLFLSDFGLGKSEESDERLVWARGEVATFRTRKGNTTEAGTYDKALLLVMTNKKPLGGEKVRSRVQRTRRQ